MKKRFSVIIRALICIYVLFSLSSVCAWFYQCWDGDRKRWTGQWYYMDGLDLASFKQKYESLCSNDSVSRYYISPYHGDKKSVRFVFEEDKTGMSCEFYSEKEHALMEFDVWDKRPLEIFFWGIKLSIQSPNEEDFRFGINTGGSRTRDYKYMTLFENKILSHIGTFKRDDRQGMICWYANFFESHFTAVLIIGIILFVINRKRMTRGRFCDHFLS